MIRKRAIYMMAALVAAGMSMGLIAQERQEQTRELRFEIGLDWSNETYPEVTHIGRIHLRKDRDFVNFSWVHAIPTSSLWNQMSEKQREFVGKLRAEWHASKRDNFKPGDPITWPGTPTGMTTYHLLGVSEDDTRKLVRAFLEVSDKVAQGELDSLRNQLDAYREEISKLEKEIPELQAKMRIIKPKFMAMEEKMKDLDPKETNKEYKKMLALIEVEIVGIRARIDQIKQERSVFEKGIEPSLMDAYSHLLKLQITANVDLAGALARQEAVKAAIDEFAEYFALTEEYSLLAQALDPDFRGPLRAFSSKRLVVLKLKNVRDKVKSREKLLSDPSASMQPVEVYQNQVTIFPIGKE